MIEQRVSDQFSGDNSDCEPPDPFSNSEVKPVSADDSVGSPCESRTLPDLIIKPRLLTQSGFFYGYPERANIPHPHVSNRQI